MYRVSFDKGYSLVAFDFKDFEEATIFAQTALLKCTENISINIKRLEEGEE